MKTGGLLLIELCSIVLLSNLSFSKERSPCGVRASSHLKCGLSPCQHTPRLKDTVQNRTQDVSCIRRHWLFKLQYFGHVGINKLNKINFCFSF